VCGCVECWLLCSHTHCSVITEFDQTNERAADSALLGNLSMYRVVTSSLSTLSYHCEKVRTEEDWGGVKDEKRSGVVANKENRWRRWGLGTARGGSIISTQRIHRLKCANPLKKCFSKEVLLLHSVYHATRMREHMRDTRTARVDSVM
jgi:hypothetical protein